MFSFRFLVGHGSQCLCLRYFFGLVTLPGLFIPWWSQHGDVIRTLLGLAYAFVLYVAFVGKMIFYSQFHDIFNNIVFLGQKAEKHNLMDVFFNQYHGARKLALILPYLVVVFAPCRPYWPSRLYLIRPLRESLIILSIRPSSWP